jgi:hypothetical protein
VGRLLMSTSLSLIAVSMIAPSAFAQGSFCTTSVAAGGENVTKCVDAPSPTPTATTSPEETVQAGPPLSTSPTATASGTITPTLSSAVGGKLPATGGYSFALIAAALLLGSSVLSYAILHRR